MLTFAIRPKLKVESSTIIHIFYIFYNTFLRVFVDDSFLSRLTGSPFNYFIRYYVQRLILLNFMTALQGNF